MGFFNCFNVMTIEKKAWRAKNWFKRNRKKWDYCRVEVLGLGGRIGTSGFDQKTDRQTDRQTDTKVFIKFLVRHIAQADWQANLFYDVDMKDIQDLQPETKSSSTESRKKKTEKRQSLKTHLLRSSRWINEKDESSN